MELKARYSVELIEKDGQHFYAFNGEKTLYPGVTGPLGIISKPYLLPWAAKETALYTQKTLKKVRNIFGLTVEELLTEKFCELLYKRSKKQHKIKKEKAGDIGTRAHKAIDEIIKGKNPIVSNDIAWCVENFFTWYEKSNLTFVAGDTKVGSVDHGFGGSLDGLVTDSKGILHVLDFKTSNQIDEVGYSAQISAYCHSVMEMYGLDIFPGGICVRFHKEKPEIEIVEVADPQRIFKKIFLPALSIYKESQTVLIKNRILMKEKRRKKNEANKAEN